MEKTEQYYTFVEPLRPARYTVAFQQGRPGYWTWVAYHGHALRGDVFASGTLAGPRTASVARKRIEAEVLGLHEAEVGKYVSEKAITRVIEDLERYAERDRITARAEGEAVLVGRARGYSNAAEKLRLDLLGEGDDE